MAINKETSVINLEDLEQNNLSTILKWDTILKKSDDSGKQKDSPIKQETPKNIHNSPRQSSFKDQLLDAPRVDKHLDEKEFRKEGLVAQRSQSSKISEERKSDKI